VETAEGNQEMNITMKGLKDMEVFKNFKNQESEIITQAYLNPISLSSCPSCPSW
jgi:hypothetical protein